MDIADASMRKPDAACLRPGLRAAWKRLGRLPDGLVLHGEAALSMWLGRDAGDGFEFLAEPPFDLEMLRRALAALDGADLEREEGRTLTALLPDSGVKASFTVRGSLQRQARPPVRTAGGALVASIPDLFGRRCKAVQSRFATRSDYMDIWDLLSRTGYMLADGLSFMLAIFGEGATPHQTLFGLAYHGWLDAPLPEPARAGILKAAQDIDLRRLAEDLPAPRIQCMDGIPCSGKGARLTQSAVAAGPHRR